MSSTLH